MSRLPKPIRFLHYYGDVCLQVWSETIQIECKQSSFLHFKPWDDLNTRIKVTKSLIKRLTNPSYTPTLYRIHWMWFKWRQAFCGKLWQSHVPCNLENRLGHNIFHFILGIFTIVTKLTNIQSFLWFVPVALCAVSFLDYFFVFVVCLFFFFVFFFCMILYGKYGQILEKLRASNSKVYWPIWPKFERQHLLE